MLPIPNDAQIEKLKRQVARYEAKGYKETAAHVALARLLGVNPPEAVRPQNTKKVKPEEKEISDGE